MKRFLSLIISVSLLFTMIPMVNASDIWDGSIASGYAGGDGSVQNPFLISNAEELAYFAKQVNDADYSIRIELTGKPMTSNSGATGVYNPPYKEMYNVYTGIHFKLTDDIDLANVEWTPIGDNNLNIFNGTFDGDGHTVKNISITEAHHKIGFFGMTGTNVTIKNLGLENINYTFRNEGNGIRGYGVGGFIGTISGGTITNCYAHNVVIKNTYAAAGAMGGFIGTGHSILYNSSPKATITNCYVSNVNISDYTSNAYLGGFMGSTLNAVFDNTEPPANAYHNASSTIASLGTWGNPGWFGVTMTMQNCYSADVALNTENGDRNKFAFAYDGYSRLSGTNIFSTSENIEKKGDFYPAGTTGVSKEDIILSLVTDKSEYVKDSPVVYVNNGLPVLKSWAYWITDKQSDIMNNLMNIVTNGQSPNYIIDNLNFITSFEYGGENYKVGYQPFDKTLITEDGMVIQKEKNADTYVNAIILNEKTNEYSNQKLNFTIASRGEKMALCSFDEAEHGTSLEAMGFMLENDTSVFSTVPSVTGNSGDYMVSIAGNGNDNKGIMTMPFAPENTDGVYKLRTSFILSEPDSVLEINAGGENSVLISLDELSLNGSVAKLKDLSVNEWNIFELIIDINTNKLTATVNGTSVKDIMAKSGLTNEYVKFIENTSIVYLDRVLYYESIANELANITYDTILNGQSRFVVTEDLYFPTETIFDRKKLNVDWTSTNTTLITAGGKVADSDYSEKVILTAYAKNEEGTVLSTKEFEVYVSPKGASLVYSDDFNTAVKGGIGISGYRNTYIPNEPAGWIKYTVDKDPTAKTTETFEDSNKAMKVNELKAGNNDAPSRGLSIPLGTTVYDGIVEICFDTYFTNLNHEWIISMNSDVGNLTQFYMMFTIKLAYFTNTLNMDGTQGGRYSFGNLKAGEWTDWRIVMDTTKKTFEVWLNGIKCDYMSKYLPSADSLKEISISPVRSKGGPAVSYVDNLVVRNFMPDNDMAAKLDAETLEIPTSVTNDFTLPSEGKLSSEIWWESSDESVISAGGIVEQGSSDKTVTLTAHVSKDEYEYTKTFDVTVLSEGENTNASELISGIAERFTFENISDEPQFYVTKDLSLPGIYNKGDAGRIGGVTVTWQSDNEAVVSPDGTVTRSDADNTVNLTAIFTSGAASAVKNVKISVPAKTNKAMFRESFENYSEESLGRTMEEVGEWKIKAPTSGVSTVTSKLWNDPSDVRNKVLKVTRTGYKNASDQAAIIKPNITSNDIKFSTMLRFGQELNNINITIGGAELDIFVTPEQIKAGDAEISVNLPINEWFKFSVYLDKVNNLATVYVDDKEISKALLNIKTESLTIDEISFLNKATKISKGSWYVDEITVCDISVTDAEAVAAAKNELAVSGTTLEWNMEKLPLTGKYGTKITWVSSDENILESDGTVHRAVGDDKQVMLTATIERNGTSDTKVFDIIVKGLTGNETPTLEMFTKHTEEIDFSVFSDEFKYYITKDLNLPSEYHEGNCEFYGGMNIEWKSSNEDVISNTGKVTRQVLDTPVVLAATYSSVRNPEISVTIEYKVCVWANSEVVFRDDFEYVGPENEGALVMDYDKNKWLTELREESVTGSYTFFAKDYHDADKKWEDANITVCVDRFMASEWPTRTTYTFDKDYAPNDNVIISYELMPETVGGIYFNSDISGLGGPSFAPTWFGFGDYTYSKTLTEREWHTVTIVDLRSAGHKLCLIDGELTIDTSAGSMGYISTMMIDIARVYSGYKGYIDNIIVRKMNDSDEAAIEKAIAELKIESGKISENLDLPCTGEERVQISYKSSNPDVLTDNGEVIRPSGSDEKATLTAYIRRGNVLETRDYDFTVSKQDSSAAYTIKDLNPQDKVLSAVSLTKNSNAGEKGRLIVELRNQGQLTEVRSIDLSELSSGTYDISVATVDYSDIEYFTLKAYVIEGNKITSNIESVSYGQ